MCESRRLLGRHQLSIRLRVEDIQSQANFSLSALRINIKPCIYHLVNVIYFEPSAFCRQHILSPKSKKLGM